MRLNSVFIALHVGKKNTHGLHQLVIGSHGSLQVLSQVPTTLDTGGFYATDLRFCQRFWWPHLHQTSCGSYQLAHMPSTTQLEFESLLQCYSSPSSPRFYIAQCICQDCKVQIYCPGHYSVMHLARVFVCFTLTMWTSMWTGIYQTSLCMGTLMEL